MIVSKYLVFFRSTAPDVEPLSEYKQENKNHAQLYMLLPTILIIQRGKKLE